MADIEPNGALEYAEQAVRLSPDSATVQDTIGWIYYRKGDFNTAATHLRTAVAKESSPRRQFHLAMAYLRLGQLERGNAMLAAALAQDPALAREK